MKSKQLTGLVFLDFKKAFDTVSHVILIKNYEHYGIRGTVNKLFKSYFQGHKQFVTINGYYLIPYFMVPPQGSNLGPILFSVYVNYIFNNFDTPPVLCANDTCLNISAKKRGIANIA